jgi:hypothetical protein
MLAIKNNTARNDERLSISGTLGDYQLTDFEFCSENLCYLSTRDLGAGNTPNVFVNA